MDRGSWRATVRGVTKSRPQRSSQPWNGTGGVRVKAALPARVELAAGASGVRFSWAVSWSVELELEAQTLRL